MTLSGRPQEAGLGLVPDVWCQQDYSWGGLGMPPEGREGLGRGLCGSRDLS